MEEILKVEAGDTIAEQSTPPKPTATSPRRAPVLTIESHDEAALPGAELEFSLYMVWMESMITVCGRTSRMVSEMMSRFVSQNRRSLSEKLN